MSVYVKSFLLIAALIVAVAIVYKDYQNDRRV